MEIDVIRQFGELMDAFGLKLERVSRDNFDKVSFDAGLRSSLQDNYDYASGIQRMEAYYEDNVIYMIKDIFEAHYVSFLLPEQLWESREKEFMHLGPYITRNPEEMIDGVMEKNDLPILFRKELEEYYYGIPLIRSEELLESIILNQAGYLMGDRENITINRIQNVDVEHFSMKRLAYEPDDRLSMAFIEERYRCEERMLEAIRAGNLEKAIEASKMFNIYRLQPRSGDRLRNMKNLMIVWNTLLRKAVQEADVHPAHLDHTSAMFAKKIEACSDMSELEAISHEMMRKYCLLVRNHSLKGYSPMIRDALNYIDFNLKEQLSLKLLAEKVNANASYLSTQFRKETGKTVTDYINEKRVHSSLVFLATTDMPIQTVAEQVGIYDENYFARLFKKYQNQTAKQYRNLMQSKI